MTAIPLKDNGYAIVGSQFQMWNEGSKGNPTVDDRTKWGAGDQPVGTLGLRILLEPVSRREGLRRSHSISEGHQ